MSDLNLKPYAPLYPMRIHPYEELLKDQNASVIDKINSIIDYLNSVGKLTNDVVKNWNTVYNWTMNDGLKTGINNKLEDMLAKGEFDPIINTVVTKIGDITTLTTTDKTNLTRAVNELVSKIGDLTTLTTPQKDTIVHSINSLQSEVTTNTTAIATNTANIATNTTNIASNASQLADITNQYINVKDKRFGAKGDFNPDMLTGTDDTASIQAAIDYADTNKLGVFIPKGSYRINGTLQFRQFTNIRSDNASLYYMGSGGTCVKVEGTSSAWIYPKMRGLKIVNARTDKTGIGLSVKFSRLMGLFEDCEFRGFEYGVLHSSSEPVETDSLVAKWAYLNHFNSCVFISNKYGAKFDVNSNGVTVDECSFISNDVYGAWCYQTVILRIVNSDFEDNGKLAGGHAILDDGCTANLYSGNYFENNGFNDTNSSVIYVHSSLAGNYYSKQAKIVDNYINASIAHTAIKFKKALGGEVQGNTFMDTIPPSGYDIDISEISGTKAMLIQGNLPSKNGSFNYNSYDPTAFMQHSNSVNLTRIIKKQTTTQVFNATDVPSGATWDQAAYVDLNDYTELTLSVNNVNQGLFAVYVLWSDNGTDMVQYENVIPSNKFLDIQCTVPKRHRYAKIQLYNTDTMLQTISLWEMLSA